MPQKKKEINESQFYAFGKQVPKAYVEELLEEYALEQLTIEFLETILWYEYLDTNN